jgi:hypothetical protein
MRCWQVEELEVKLLDQTQEVGRLRSELVRTKGGEIKSEGSKTRRGNSLAWPLIRLTFLGLPREDNLCLVA